jgi:hypothetical protein
MAAGFSAGYGHDGRESSIEIGAPPFIGGDYWGGIKRFSSALNADATLTGSLTRNKNE